MRFFKEYCGFIWEFNSLSEWFSFRLGMLCAWPVFIFALDLLATFVCIVEGDFESVFPLTRAFFIILGLILEFFWEL